MTGARMGLDTLKVQLLKYELSRLSTCYLDYLLETIVAIPIEKALISNVWVLWTLRDIDVAYRV